MTDVPQILDRFEIIRILGKGGMGTVYLARDQTLGRQVALKIINAEGLSEADRQNRFMREVRAAGAVRHANVATVYEVGETDDGQPFIVMEYCEGETLSQRMRRRPLDAGEFLGIARQIASALDAAHSQGVIHRDIKAANVILEPSGLVKILDFGLAKLQPREVEAKHSIESTSGHFFGTLHYLSPEQAAGKQADERSDLFSAGVVFYQMASGHLPFNGDTALMTLDRIRNDEPEPFTPLDPSFPIDATRVISRLLQKDPADRYQTAADLREDIENIELPTMRSMSHTRKALRRTTPQPRWGRLAIIITLLVFGGISIWFFREQYLQTTAEKASAVTPPTPIRSMAVLPLQNLAGNQQDQFLSMSLADALVTKIQKISSLQVRPTSAVVAYRDEKVDAKTAGSRLGVDGILEGHFLAAGDLVRVNLQLTDTRTGYSVWADSVDGKRANLLELIDSVTARTTDALNAKLGVEQPVSGSSEARSKNPRAYEQYLRARALTGSFSQNDFNAQLAALRKAIELDPEFAAAHADLAIAISLGSVRSLISDPGALEKAEWYARQAVRIDPNLAAAHLALGRVFVRDPHRFRESIRENLAALRLAPSDPAALWVLATYFVSSGDLEKVQCISERIVKIDPASNEARTRGYWNVNAVDPDGAIENAVHALASEESKLAGHDMRGVAYVLLGNLPAAEREAAAALELAPKHYLGKSLEAMIASARGDASAAEAAILSFRGDAERNHWAAIRVALCYARLGDREQALDWLRHAAELGHHSWYALIKHPWFQPLQADPEFQNVLGPIKADIDDVHDDVIGVYQLICK